MLPEAGERPGRTRMAEEHRRLVAAHRAEPEQACCTVVAPTSSTRPSAYSTCGDQEGGVESAGTELLGLQMREHRN